MNVGFIGLGIMGAPMSKNIKQRGTDIHLTVFNRNRKAKKELEDIGARFADSSTEVVRDSEVIFTMVPTARDVSNLYQEFIGEVRGKILVDMSTIEPEISIAISQKIRNAGGLMLDAPVVKSKAAAMEASLGIYVGGEKSACEKVRPLLACMGSQIMYLGDNGAGLRMKICHNMLVGQIQNGVNEMMCLAQKFGIAPATFAEAVNCGGGTNAYLSNKAENIQNMQFPTAFSVENMHKDVHIAAAMVCEAGLSFPGTEAVVQVYDRAMTAGLGKEDFSASYKVVRNCALD